MEALLRHLPDNMHGLRAVLTSDLHDGKSTLVRVLDGVRTGQFQRSMVFVNSSQGDLNALRKLGIISALAVILESRGIHYSLDAQAQDFALFSTADTLLIRRCLNAFTRSALPIILQACRIEDRLREDGRLAEDWQLGLQLMVAIGLRAMEWYEDVADSIASQELAEDTPPIDSAQLGNFLEGTILEAYARIDSDLHTGMCSFPEASNRLAQSLGAPKLYAV